MTDQPDIDGLLAFSRAAADTFEANMLLYAELIDVAADLSNQVVSADSDSALSNLRAAAAEIADACAWISRTIAALDGAYRDARIGADRHPGMLRQMLLEVLDSSVLLTRVASIHDLDELPVIDPARVTAWLNVPQVSQWLAANHTPAGQPLTDPAAHGPSVAHDSSAPPPPAASPYDVLRVSPDS